MSGIRRNVRQKKSEVIPMYDELIEELRQHHCDAKEDDTQEVCEECAYDVIIADKSAPSGKSRRG